MAYREERRDEQRGEADRDPDEYDPNADAAEAYGDAVQILSCIFPFIR